MPEMKICIGSNDGKTYQKSITEQQAKSFYGLNIGENVKGEVIDLHGYELLITGGSDYCGFPMRKGILGIRKRISILKGVGFRGFEKGVKKRKTVCGHKITEQIVQVNLKISKEGNKPLSELFIEQKAESDKK
jgi:small subunit ribosomal protein S6e